MGLIRAELVVRRVCLDRERAQPLVFGVGHYAGAGVMLNQIKVSQPKKHRFRNPMTSSTGPGLPGRAASLSFDAETSARRCGWIPNS
jgi:hypothetical protein